MAEWHGNGDKSQYGRADLQEYYSHGQHSFAGRVARARSFLHLRSGQPDAHQEAVRLHSKALKVLLAVDGSSHSEAATKFVMELNWPEAACFEVLAVAPERWPLLGVRAEAQSVLEETANKVLQVELASAERIAARTAADLIDHGLAAVGNVRTGRASQAILLRADEMAADLIVVGARGLSAPGDFHLGSTAHQLAADADQAVLIVRPPSQPQPLSVILAADGSPEADKGAAFLCRLSLPRWAEVTIINA
jgi:nucleotide-binding universal stress UspA family protein